MTKPKETSLDPADAKLPGNGEFSGTERVAPLVHESGVKRNRAGSVFCQWHVGFPKGGVPEDLADPTIWRRCQNSGGTAFKRKDEVRIDAYDGSWSADCIVSHASLTEVILAVKTMTKLPPRREHLYADDLYEVRFVGIGYSVFRKQDDHRMKPDAYPNPEVARQHLLDLYPKRVA